MLDRTVSTALDHLVTVMIDHIVADDDHVVCSTERKVSPPRLISIRIDYNGVEPRMTVGAQRGVSPAAVGCC